MRVWDIPVSLLCRQHLLGQHNEIHVMHKVIRTGSRAWSNHPETKRWVGKLDALKVVHDITVAEMLKRGYNHHTSIEVVGDSSVQGEMWQTIDEQKNLLLSKGCKCKI